MTPEAASILSSLREDFYRTFKAKLKAPVKVSKGKSLIFNPAMAPIVSWVDQHNRSNYLSIYAHTAPDALIPHRPLLLRVAVNLWPSTSGQSAKSTKESHLNRDWSWEITLLPEEIMAFAAWLASWIGAEGQSTELAQRSPYPLEFFTPVKGQATNLAWTLAALNKMESAQDKAA